MTYYLERIENGFIVSTPNGTHEEPIRRYHVKDVAELMARLTHELVTETADQMRHVWDGKMEVEFRYDFDPTPTKH
jgi:hypothetical protein